MTLSATPAELTESVRTAVAEGAWTPGDVSATVIAEVRAGRSDVLATLWDLVDAGELVYDHHAPAPGFRAVGVVTA